MIKKGLFLLFLLFLVSCGNKEEKIYEKELMNIEVSGYDNSKQFNGSDVKEIKKVLRKKFNNLELIAVTKDGRFFIRKNVTDGKNKELTGKEVTIDRVDIIDLIFYKSNTKMKIIKKHLKKGFLNIQELQDFRIENNFSNK